MLLPKVLAVVVLTFAVQETAGQFCSLRGCCSGEDDSCSTPDGIGDVCYCDHFCLLTGDCCPDYAAICDEDECASEPSVCHVNATCHNTVGSYECVCKEGFVGNGAHCVDETLGPCATHTSINDPRRSSAFVPGPNDALICDNVLPAGWYRFGTDTGGKMPETCVEQFHCGTQVPVWLNGAHPTDYQVVDREGCMNYGVPDDCCTLTVQIQVQRCPASNGNPDFFIYNLQPTFACSIGYCADPTPVDNTTTALPTRPIRQRSEPSVTRAVTTGSSAVSQRTAPMAARTLATSTDSSETPTNRHNTAKRTSMKPEDNSGTAGESTTPMGRRTRTVATDEQQSTASTSRRTTTGAVVTEMAGNSLGQCYQTVNDCGAFENNSSIVATPGKGVIIGATCAGLIFVLVTSIIICVLCRKRKPLQITEVTPIGDGAVAMGNLKKTGGDVHDVMADVKRLEDPRHEHAGLSSFTSPLKLAGSTDIVGGLKDQQGASKPSAASTPTDDHTYQSLGPTDLENNHEYQSLTPLGRDYENLGFVSE